MTVLYRLAKPGGEYNRLYALMRREIGHKNPLGWPTVVAVENKKVIGFLSTLQSKDAIVAGPLVIEGANRPFVFVRLCEAYENVLTAAGASMYLFAVAKNNTKQVERISSFGIPVHGEDDQRVWFRRELKHGRW